MLRRVLAILPSCLLAFSLTAQAQGGRTLHWQNLTVKAHLDADGQLVVQERQGIVFNGDWNGGERTFNIRPGQVLASGGMSRIDSLGEAHPLSPGDLSQVDHYDWVNARVLRWRSRMPSDPPFVNRLITYQINYALSYILKKNGDAYTLDNDFAFPDRVGAIDHFTLDFDADPVWQSGTLPMHVERDDMAPGASFVVTMPLHYRGSGTPKFVREPISAKLRAGLLLGLLFSVGFALLRFFRAEIARGRFEPLRPPHYIDEAWLRENLFNVPPEVVGAAWDETTAAPEVSAFIARMVQEGKLSTRMVEYDGKPVLQLTMLVPWEKLSADEERLAAKLFVDDRKQTDTEIIKKHYKGSGFNPASTISSGIQQQVKALVPNDADDKASGLVTFLVFTAAAVLFVSTVVSKSFRPIAFIPGVTVAIAFVGLVAAMLYRRTVINLPIKALFLTVALLALQGPTAAVLLNRVPAAEPLTMLQLIQLSALAAMLSWFLIRVARTSESHKRLEMRRNFAAARAYFMMQLSHEHPSLKDEWFPYLLAFGLSPEVDKWFAAFGSQAGVMATSMGAMTASGGTWTGGGALFGGSGGFGGGGAGRSWASAVDTMSAGVSSPGSSGGGGGGGSSGGGGGGGW